MDELLQIIRDLSDGKAAGLSGWDCGLSNDVFAKSHSALTKSSCDIRSMFECLLTSECSFIKVYTNESVKSLGSIGACGGTAAYFPKTDASIGVKVLGLLFSTLVKLQTITLALECVPISNTVELFTDSQVSLDVCKFNVSILGSDFCHKCYIKKEHIHQVILKKNLLVM
ncbi:hypothetical protein G9A89_005273 [Geosiphon pyriformis]|nr:hypothetical protein G9A89_005273 [Geosiphon pyriformis]